MIHASDYKPRVIPVFGNSTSAEIDRLQELSATVTLNRTKIEEIGRVGLVDWRKTNPDVSLALRQLEYGNLEFYRKLANKGDSVVTIQMVDYKTPAVDIVGYKTDDNGTFLGTVFYPSARVAGMGLAIGDPDALIERSFALVCEDETLLLDNNKYLIEKTSVIAAAGLAKTVTLSDPTPNVDPDNSGQFLFRVSRVRAGVGTELNHGADWSYNGAGTLTINGQSEANDIIKVIYSASTYVSGASTFVKNDVDLAGITADSVSIYLESSNYLYKLQSVGVDTTFDRYDVKEIGDEKVKQRGVRDVTNRITLGRILEQYTIEEVLRGKAGVEWGKIDARELSDELSIIIKIYEDATKTTFKLGYKYTGLAPVGLDAGTPVSDYVTRGVTLEGEEGFITTVEGQL